MRNGAPAVDRQGRSAVMLASDVPALLPHANEFCQLEDGRSPT